MEEILLLKKIGAMSFPPNCWDTFVIPVSIDEQVNVSLRSIEISRNRRLLNKILETVEEHDLSDGISEKELLKKLNDKGVHLRYLTVIRNCKKLERLDLITKENKQAKYHLTERYKLRIVSVRLFEGSMLMWQI